jgi:hypothetical protein
MSGYQRRYIAAGVDMLEHRPRYTVSKEGWARHDAMEDIAAQCTSATAEATEAVVGHGSGDSLRTTQFIESGLNTAICRPYILNTTSGAYWNVSPAADVDLETEVGKRWGLTWTRQCNMKAESDSWILTGSPGSPSADGTYTATGTADVFTRPGPPMGYLYKDGDTWYLGAGPTAKTYYASSPDGTWYEYPATEPPTEVEDMAASHAEHYVASEWVTQYTLAPNPYLLIGIRRPGRPEDCEAEPFTDITLGLADGKGWSLHIPYGDNALWHELVNGTWQPRDWTHGSHHIPEGAQGEQQELVFIISVVRGALCVSMMGDGQGDTFAWCRPGGEDSTSGWAFVKSSELRVRHYPGELAVLAHPLYMTETWLTSPDFWVGQDYGNADDTYFDDHNAALAYRLGAHAWGYNVAEGGYSVPQRTSYAGDAPDLAPGECRVSVADHEEDGLATNYCRYRVHLAPYVHTSTADDDTEVKSYSSPGCTGVEVERMAVLTDGGALAVDTDVTSRVNSIELDFAEDFGATETRMRVLNRANNSYWASGIGTFRAFHIRNHRWREYYPALDTWRDADETTSLEYVWSLEPELQGQHAEVPCVDLLGVINHARVHGQVPVGDGWDLHDYIRHTLYLAQVGDAMMTLEDIGVTIPFGTPEKPACVPERGRRFGEWLAYLQDKYGDHGAVWAELGQIVTGCRYCGTVRTVADYQSHHDNGWKSSGCLAADLERTETGIDQDLFCNPEDATDPDALGRMAKVRVYKATLDDEVFANWVNVAGEDLDRRALGSTVYDYASLHTPAAANYTGGWKIMRVETDTALRSQAAVTRRAYTLLNDLSEEPLWFSGEVIADGSLLRGYTVAVKGGADLGLDDAKARIVKLSLPIIRDGVPYVRLYCRIIGTVS